jgi:hypothetical protein
MTNSYSFPKVHLALTSEVHAPDASLHVGRCAMLRVMDSVAANTDSVTDFMRDVDRTLLRENLKLTPEQRLEKFASFMRFVAELRRAGENVRRSGKPKIE